MHDVLEPTAHERGHHARLLAHLAVEYVINVYGFLYYLGHLAIKSNILQK